MLRNLNDVDKKDLTELLAAIEKTFSLYWQHYPPYNTLQDRGSALDTLLHDKSADNRKDRRTFLIIYLLQRRRYNTCFCPCLFVCLSVCLLARLLKNACMDLDEMLHIDRCRDMDELIIC